MESFGAAVAIEVALIGALVAWVLARPSLPLEAAVPLTIEAPAVPAAPQPATPEPVASRLQKAPAAKSVPKPVEAAPPVPKTTSATPLADAAVAAVAAPPSPVVALAAPLPPPAAPGPPAPSAPGIDPAVAYNARLAAAVQRAFEAPAVAVELGFKGRARVEFALRDGLVSAVRLVQGSGLGAVDRAAARAVLSAAFPAPPEPLRGKDGIYQIWVACY